MAVNLEAIKNAAKAKLISESVNARSADTIDAALEIQAEGFAQAIKEAFETFLAQAVVAGGTCVDGGPVSGATIT